MKIDRSVIAEADSNPRSAAIVYSVIGLCRNLGLHVTIEGVERLAQLDFLSACGDVSIQGFLVGGPVEAAEVVRLVHGIPERLGSLLLAATSAGTIEDDLTSSVRMLRRHRR